MKPISKPSTPYDILGNCNCDPIGLYNGGFGLFKIKVGRQLNSNAILQDANCTKACLYLSFTLLLASAGYELTGIGGFDSIGAILIAIFSIREGLESFEKARG